MNYNTHKQRENNMDKSRQLIIRACRSGSPRFRLSRLHARFYIPYKTNTQRARQILQILSDINRDYDLMTVDEFMTDTYERMAICPDYYINNAEMSHDKFIEASICTLISKIRLSKNAIFKGITPPFRFRSKG